MEGLKSKVICSHPETSLFRTLAMNYAGARVLTFDLHPHLQCLQFIFWVSVFQKQGLVNVP